MAYAKGTTVSIARSKEEIERVLARYGADSFGYATEGNRALVTFSMESRRIRMFLRLPEFEDFELTPTRLKRTAPAQRRAYEQGCPCRERWRSLALIERWRSRRRRELDKLATQRIGAVSLPLLR